MGMKRYASIQTEGVNLNLNSRRNRILTAYSEFIESLEEHPEEKNEEGNLLDHEDGYDDEGYGYRRADRWYNTGICGKVCSCMRYFCSVDESTIPFKLLYIFTRGGYAAITTYLTVYFTQIGISPTDVGKIQFVPHLLTALVTVMAGFLADALLGNIVLLLVAVTLWGGLTLGIGLVPPPKFADCLTALMQLARVIDTGTEEDGFPKPCNLGNINLTTEQTHHWGSILRLPVTSWSDELETCYPGDHFASLTKQESTDPSKLPSYGVVFTTSQQTEIARGWMYDEESLVQAFTVVFILVAAGTMMQQVILTLTDGVTLSKLGRERRHEYGLQRSTGTAGFAVW